MLQLKTEKFQFRNAATVPHGRSCSSASFSSAKQVPCPDDISYDAPQAGTPTINSSDGKALIINVRLEQ